MIKVNLLESVTDRPQGVALVEDKVASPRIQTLLLALTVFGLMTLAMGYDYVSTNMAHTAAQKELDNQKRINQQMLAIQKEQQELEKKSKEIQARIDAIKKLRVEQPVISLIDEALLLKYYPDLGALAAELAAPFVREPAAAVEAAGDGEGENEQSKL